MKTIRGNCERNFTHNSKCLSLLFECRMLSWPECGGCVVYWKLEWNRKKATCCKTKCLLSINCHCGGELKLGFYQLSERSDGEDCRVYQGVQRVDGCCCPKHHLQRITLFHQGNQMHSITWNPAQNVRACDTNNLDHQCCVGFVLGYRSSCLYLWGLHWRKQFEIDHQNVHCTD